MQDILLKIRRLQEGKKITIKEFSKLIGVSSQTIYDYYNGKTSLSIKNLIKIAKAFDIPVSYFFEEGDNSKKIIGNGNQVNTGINNSNNKTGADCSIYIQEIEYLKQQIKDKQEIINLLKNK